MLQSLLAFLKPLAARYGGPGLAALAFADSSFLSLPQVPDAAILLLVTENPARWLYYTMMATAGSVVGCYALYAVARKGGEAMFRKRMGAGAFERHLRTVQRYGLLAVIVPSILPPPAPFKVFVILAGLSGITPGAFTLAVLVGRLFRYGVEAAVAYKYGNQALAFLDAHLGKVSIALAVAIAVMGVIAILWQRRRAQ
jgi:membrane protein YqaA with SNARE-associated domain